MLGGLPESIVVVVFVMVLVILRTTVVVAIVDFVVVRVISIDFTIDSEHIRSTFVHVATVIKIVIPTAVVSIFVGFVEASVVYGVPSVLRSISMPRGASSSRVQCGCLNESGVRCIGRPGSGLVRPVGWVCRVYRRSHSTTSS